MMKNSIHIFVTLFSIFLHSYTNAAALFGMFEKKKYTPLIMFKVPKGTIEDCDEMDKIVRSVEKELDVKVERLDILRDRFARNLYEKIDEVEFRGKVPLLYHRESLQSIYGLDTKERVRAWAKGRWLPSKLSGIDGKGSGSGEFLPDEQEEQGELLMEEDLSELQQLGREKMLERLDEKRF
jgi:hypothetical protein